MQLYIRAVLDYGNHLDVVVYLTDKVGWSRWSLFNPPTKGHADKELQ